MAVAYIRPNADRSNSSGWTKGGTGPPATFNAALSDGTDFPLASDTDATYAQVAGAKYITQTLEVSLESFSIPAGSLVQGFGIYARSALVSPSDVSTWMYFTIFLKIDDPIYGIQNLPIGVYPFHDIVDIISNESRTESAFNKPASLGGGDWTQADIDNAFLHITTTVMGDGTNATARIYGLTVSILYNATPTATVTAPAEAGTVTTTTRPTITYTYADTESDPQERVQAKIYHSSVYGMAGFSPDDERYPVVWDSSITYQTGTSLTPDVDLAPTGSYRAYVRVGSTRGDWGVWDSNTFTMAVTVPAAPTLTVTADQTNRRVRLSAVAAASQFIRFEYADGNEWKIVHNASGLTTDAAFTAAIYDESAPFNKKRRYRVRAYTLTSNLYQMGNPSVEQTATLVVTTGDWWLKDLTRDAYSIDFDGTNDHVLLADLDNTFDFAGTAPFTLEGWIRPDSIATTNKRIMEKMNSTIDGWRFYITTTGSIAIDRIIASAAQSKVSTTGLIVAGNWYHIAASYDSALLHVFLMGVENGAGAASAGVLPGNGNGTAIGGTTVYFDGKMKEMRIWNYARSAAEIAADMNRQLRGDEPGLIGYWPMDDGTGVIASDLTNGKNVGVLTGGPLWARDLPPILGQPINLLAPVLKSSEEEVQNAYSPLGRPMKVIVADVIHGEELKLDIEFYGLEEFERFNLMRRSGRTLLLQAYSGEQWYIRLGRDRDVDRGMSYNPAVYNVTVEAFQQNEPTP